jgi:spore photoproduct lyase
MAACAITPSKPKLWMPRQVLVTPDAFKHRHGIEMAERVAQLGARVVELKNNRLGIPADD